MSFLSSPDTFIATLLGGLLAEIIGLITSRYVRRLRRREAYLREHKANFEVIQEALVSLKTNVWPLTAKGSEKLTLPRVGETSVDTGFEELLDIGLPTGRTIGIGIGDDRIKVTNVDKVLYSDISTHFSDISAKLVDVERMTKTDGVRVDELVYKMSNAIYREMVSSDLSVLRFTFDRGKRAALQEIPLDGLEGLNMQDGCSYC